MHVYRYSSLLWLSQQACVSGSAIPNSLQQTAALVV